MRPAQKDAAAFTTRPHLTELRLLNLSHNEMTHLYGFHFEGLFMLRELYLQHNRLVSIAKQTFNGLSHLTTLYLDNNLLIAFPVWVLGDQLSQLTLSSNQWQCECEFMRRFHLFVDTNKEAILDVNNINCTSSHLDRGLSKDQQCTELMPSNLHSQVLREN